MKAAVDARDRPKVDGEGRVVALTQSPGRLEGLQELLESRGFQVVRRPLVTTVPRLDEATRSRVEELSSLPWLLLTSRSTVEALAGLGFRFSSAATDRSGSSRTPAPPGSTPRNTAPLIGVIGPGTGEALERAGGSAAFVAERHDSQGLVEAFRSHPRASGPVGLPRGSRALLDTQRSLEQAGFETRPLIVYDTRQGSLADEPVDAIVLASPSAVGALPEVLPGSPRLVAIGATTASAARKRGLACELAAAATPQAVAEALERGIR